MSSFETPVEVRRIPLARARSVSVRPLDQVEVVWSSTNGHAQARVVIVSPAAAAAEIEPNEAGLRQAA